MTPTPKRCSAKACVASGTPCSTSPMFKFPRDLERCAIWVKNSGNEKLLKIPSKRLCVRSYLCADHFEEGHFFDKFKRRLKRNAIPTLFPSTPLSDKLMLMFPVLEDLLDTLDAVSPSALNILRNKYNSFSLPCSRETLNRMVSIQQSVTSKETEHPGYDARAIPHITQENYVELNEEERDHGYTIIRIPSYESSTNGLNLMPGPGSITYIEGPWSNQPEVVDPISVEILDNSIPVSKELLIDGRHVEHSSDNEYQEIIVHHVDIKIDENCDNLSKETLMLPTTTSPSGVDFGLSGTHSSVLPIVESNQISDFENTPAPAAETHLVIQSKQLTNGGQVHVKCIAPADVTLQH